ncbi:TPA: hypothetical protein SL272_000821 [Pseudomonas aeruginosa]|nr:hypothetical protein [Pseudomonas aeruginosa]
MANPCDISISAATASDLTKVGRASMLLSSAVATSLLTVTVAASTMSAAQASDFTNDGGGPVVIDHAVATSSTVAGRRGGVDSLDRARAQDRAYPTLINLVSDSAQASSLVIQRAATQVLEQAHATSLLQDRRTSTSAELSRGQARSFFLARHADSVLDTGAASSSLAGRVRAASLALDQAQASSLLLAASASVDLTISQAQASSFITSQTRTSSLALDEADTDDFAEDGRGGLIWTCRSETFGMSRLLSADLRSLAVVQGTLCAVGPGGLYALDAAALAPKVVTGLTDFGSEAEKRASYAYFGYSGAPLTIRMGVVGEGSELTYSYDAPARVANAPVPGRVKLGKGARSRYWRFTILGSAFQLHDVKLIIDETSRSI